MKEEINKIRIETLKSSIAGYRPDAALELYTQAKFRYKNYGNEIQKLIDLAREVIKDREDSLKKVNKIETEEDILNSNEDLKRIAEKYNKYLSQFEKVNKSIMEK